jgi:hypothetical protein
MNFNDIPMLKTSIEMGKLFADYKYFILSKIDGNIASTLGPLCSNIGFS